MIATKLRNDEVNYCTSTLYSYFSILQAGGKSKFAMPLLCWGTDDGDDSASQGKLLDILMVAKQGDLPNLSRILSKNRDPRLLNARDLTGNSPLILAAWHDRVDAATMLLEHRADVNACNFDGNNALHCAAWRGHSNVAGILLSFGAHVDVPDGLSRKTALIKVCMSSCVSSKAVQV